MWNGGYQCAVTLSVDFDAETLWDETFGLKTPSPLSRGDYDIRAGLPRILDLLDRPRHPSDVHGAREGGRRSPRCLS
jgi:hypothetical protein